MKVQKISDYVRFALLMALLDPLAVYAGISYSESVSKPKESGYPGGVGTSRSNAKNTSSQQNNETWSGSWNDLKKIQAEAWNNYGRFEGFSHLGRDVVELKPYSMQSMQDCMVELSTCNHDGWYKTPFDDHHQPEGQGASWYSNPPNAKYKSSKGGEVVYNKETGKIDLSPLMGTKNFGTDGLASYKFDNGAHKVFDVTPHEKNNQYKYGGILYEVEIGSNGENIYYIVDGQTGKRMTNKQVHEFPTTMSDMWKNKGRQCVSEDATPVVAVSTPIKFGGVIGPTQIDKSDNKQLNEDRELASDEIPDPDNDDYVWCEDVCGEEGLRPVCPKDTENVVYWGCSRCRHVIRKKARKAKRFERSLKEQGKEGHWHGTQLEIRQAKSVDDKGI